MFVEYACNVNLDMHLCLMNFKDNERKQLKYNFHCKELKENVVGPIHQIEYIDKVVAMYGAKMWDIRRYPWI